MRHTHADQAMPPRVGLLLLALAMSCGGTATRNTDSTTGGANGAGASGMTAGGANAANSGGAAGHSGAISNSGATNSAGATGGTEALGGTGPGGTAGSAAAGTGAMGAAGGGGLPGTQGHYVTPSANGQACAAPGALQRFGANFQVCTGGCGPGCPTWTCACRDGVWLCLEPEFGCDSDPVGSTLCSTKAELRYHCFCSSDALRCEQSFSSGGGGGSGGSQ